MWKDIVGFDNYELSDAGEVRNKKTRRLVKAWPTNGLLRVSLYQDGRQHLRYVHKLVAGDYRAPRETAAPEPTIDDDAATWRPVVGFEQYEMDENGRVRKVDTKRVLKITENNSAAAYRLIRDGRAYTVSVHYAVAMAFILGFDREKHFIRHRDGDKRNNRVENLIVKERNADPVPDEQAMAERRQARERERRLKAMRMLDAKIVSKAEQRAMQVLAYNEQIAARKAERQNVKPERRTKAPDLFVTVERSFGFVVKSADGWQSIALSKTGEQTTIGTFSSLRDATNQLEQAARAQPA